MNESQILDQRMRELSTKIMKEIVDANTMLRVLESTCIHEHFVPNFINDAWNGNKVTVRKERSGEKYCPAMFKIWIYGEAKKAGYCSVMVVVEKVYLICMVCARISYFLVEVTKRY